MANENTNPEDMAWEDRVRRLEAGLQQKDSEIQALQAQLAEAKGLIEAHKAAEAERESQAFADLISETKKKACDAGSPLKAETVARIESLWKAGQKEAAHDVASMALELSSLRGGGSTGPAPEPQTVPLGAAQGDAPGAWSKEDQAEFRGRWNLNKN